MENGFLFCGCYRSLDTLVAYACLLWRYDKYGIGDRHALDFCELSLRLMRHADSAPSVYGNSKLWLSNFPPIKGPYFIIFCLAKPPSHRIELPYTEGAESARLISRRDSIGAIF